MSRYAANTDRSAFDEPSTFVPDREPNRHTSFGLGIHRCVGSHLGRAMFQEIISQMPTKYPDHSIDHDSAVPYPDQGCAIGWTTLPATV